MDRTIYKQSFRESSLPPWQCPTCPAGTLHLVKGTFRSDETATSRNAKPHPAWEPEWMQYTYSCHLQCGNVSCGEIVCSTGDGHFSADGGEDEYGYRLPGNTVFYQPKYFWPHLQIINLPDQTPDPVADELNQSFELFFCNPASSANHVRIALENLLSNLGVKRFTTKNGKRHPLALHHRVDLLPTKYDEVRKLCVAIKWLGNSGSHAGDTMTMDDVMDVYDLIDPVLRHTYDTGLKFAKKLASGINKRKGPNRKKRK
jgi:hypothetical protein